MELHILNVYELQSIAVIILTYMTIAYGIFQRSRQG